MLHINVFLWIFILTFIFVTPQTPLPSSSVKIGTFYFFFSSNFCVDSIKSRIFFASKAKCDLVEYIIRSQKESEMWAEKKIFLLNKVAHEVLPLPFVRVPIIVKRTNCCNHDDDDDSMPPWTFSFYFCLRARAFFVCLEGFFPDQTAKRERERENFLSHRWCESFVRKGLCLGSLLCYATQNVNSLFSKEHFCWFILFQR